MVNDYENFYDLTVREMQVLSLLCQKITDSREIGKILCISKSTVKANLSSMYLKLGVKDKTQAVIEALSKKIIDSQILNS